MHLVIEPFAKQETFAEFCDRNGLQPVATERASTSGLARWHVSIKGLEIAEGGLLTTTHGNGATPHEALADYARQLAGHRLAVDAMGRDRRDLAAPNEWTAEPTPSGK